MEKREMKKINQSQEPKIAIYTRNTSIEQPVGHRLHRDIHVLKDRCERNGYKIQRIYSDGDCSGKDLIGRLSLIELMLNVASGKIDMVIVWDLFSLSSSAEDILTIKTFFDFYNVELLSATEQFDTSTSEGELHFQQMMSLLEYEHLACKQDISLSSLAHLIITEGESMKGGEWNAGSSHESNRTA
ncbi:hypothetical protein BKN48_09590 [Bacillus subtilis]|nr:hypothetical protein BKN48_09590 [Bacillus subtilis]